MKKKLITRVGDQLVNHNCIKSLGTNYFVIVITFVGIRFSSLLFQFKTIHTFLTWKKKVGMWWAIFFEAFCMELEKRKNLLKAFFRNGDFKTQIFLLKWNKRNSWFVIHCRIVHWRYSFTPCKGLGVVKYEAPTNCCNH